MIWLSRMVPVFSLLFSIKTNAQKVKDTILTIYFETNVFSLDSSQVREISKFSSAIEGIKEITGYADSVGSIESNRSLSKLRAENTYKILQKLEIDIQNKPSFKGEEFVQNPTLKSNRKVEIVGYGFYPNNTVRQKQLEDSVLETFDIENVYFLPDKPIITQESLQYVGYLKTKLQFYHNVRFEIVGHVNYQSKKDTAFLKDLFRLSEARAKVIYDMLIDNGMPRKLLTYKGVGNLQPLIKEPTNDDERKKNMRVQILVIKR